MAKLHYWISNNGDGSASIQVEETAERAAQEDAEQDEGWAESCNGSLDLRVNSQGKIEVLTYDFDRDPYQKWVELMDQ